MVSISAQPCLKMVSVSAQPCLKMVSVSVSAQLCWIPLVTGNSYFLNRPGHEEACFRERALSPLAAKRSHNLPDILTTDYMFISELQVHVLLLEFFFSWSYLAVKGMTMVPQLFLKPC